MRKMVHPRLNGAAAMSFSLLSLSHRSSFSFTIGHFSGTSCPLRTCNSPTGAVECGGESCASAPMVSKAGSGAWIIILAVFCSPKKRLANVCVFFCILPRASSGNWREKRRSWRTKSRRCSPSGNGSECGQACESKRGRTQAAEGQWWWRYAFGIVCLFPAFAASSSFIFFVSVCAPTEPFSQFLLNISCVWFNACTALSNLASAFKAAMNVSPCASSALPLSCSLGSLFRLTHNFSIFLHEKLTKLLKRSKSTTIASFQRCVFCFCDFDILSSYLVTHVRTLVAPTLSAAAAHVVQSRKWLARIPQSHGESQCWSRIMRETLGPHLHWRSACF